jgi:general stress protein YciG
MADNNDNPGQFGNREDTQEQASKGGQMSSGKLEKGSRRAKMMGKKGGQARNNR